MVNPIVIVGGSISGLMQALQLRRDGKDVIILEQDPDPERSSNGYGMSYMATADSFIQEHDHSGRPAGYSSPGIRFAFGRWNNLISVRKPMTVTSWGYLYRILRANLDGYVSIAVPNPPALPVGHGKCDYHAGKRVTAMRELKDTVVVEYVDVTNGQKEMIKTDLVIGADGSNSTVRDLVGAPFSNEYSGYVVWRGVVKESEVSETTRQYFASGVSLDLMWRGYILCYRIPTDQGNFGPEEALLNYCLYENIAEDSTTMREILTDTMGTVHQHVVPKGAVRTEVWDRVRVEHIPYLAPPFVELLSKTDQPYLSKISDGMCDSPRHFGGKVYLIGNAFSTIRPHTGAASEQSAVHVKLMAKLRDGELTPEEWEQSMRARSQSFLLAARATGEFGQSSIFTFARHLYAYARI
ncbi:hypothetical protein FSARC_10935 [Fusarium sarcochroum]|uniref:2,6-dihydroxypyridine 3-monooxygenase substrate binding domain-containing protein n=1 Tax=Fusarium sarcochroum TaxID=1208366 RepID=A0A8H4X2J5_9HYPO|nr:hypothetical protein FSARC_10935 [Fusarium sarcochroum]